jgi:hypothetical protein
MLMTIPGCCCCHTRARMTPDWGCWRISTSTLHWRRGGCSFRSHRTTLSRSLFLSMPASRAVVPLEFSAVHFMNLNPTLLLLCRPTPNDVVSIAGGLSASSLSCTRTCGAHTADGKRAMVAKTHLLIPAAATREGRLSPVSNCHRRTMACSSPSPRPPPARPPIIISHSFPAALSLVLCAICTSASLRVSLARRCIPDIYARYFSH